MRVGSIADVDVVAVLVVKITVTSDGCSVSGLKKVMRCKTFWGRLRWWKNRRSLVCYRILTGLIAITSFAVTYDV